MSTTFLVTFVLVVLLLVVIIVGVVSCGFLVGAIAVSGLLYRVAEDRYPEAAGITGSADTGIRNPPQATPEKPLGDLGKRLKNTDLEDLDDQWLYGTGT